MKAHYETSVFVTRIEVVTDESNKPLNLLVDSEPFPYMLGSEWSVSADGTAVTVTILCDEFEKRFVRDGEEMA